MKKFLSIIGSITLVSSTVTTVVACGDNERFHRNQDYQGTSDVQSDQDKKIITESFESRIKAAILTDVYGINGAQTKEVSFKTLDHDNFDLSKNYDRYFDEKALLATPKIDFEGNLGYPGGILDLVLQSLNLSDFTKNILGKLIKIDLNSNDFRKNITKIMDDATMIVKSLTATGLANEIPNFLTQIPTDFLDGLPGIIKETFGDVTQSFIDTFMPRTTVEPVLDAMISGANLTKFNDQTISQLFDSFFAILTNFLAYGTVADFNQEFDEINVDFDQIGQFWFEHLNDFQNIKMETNLNKEVEKLFELLAMFNVLLSVYKTVDVDYKDDQHLFANDKTNDEVVSEWQAKKLSEFNFDLTNFQMGSLISNIVHFFGPNKSSQQNMQKFLYALLYNPIENSLPSFWKFSFALIKADEKSETGVVKKGIGDKLEPLYHETIGPKMLQQIVNNQPLSEISVDDNNPTYRDLVNGEFGGIKPFFDSITTTLGSKPMDVVYQGNLDPILDSLTQLAGSEWTEQFKNNIFGLIGNSHLNINSLLNVTLSKILGMAKVYQFPTNEMGLIPDYAGYYTDKSLKELVWELSRTFKMNGWETPEQLKYYTFDLNVMKGLVSVVLYDNHLNEGRGAFADAIDNLARNKSLIPVFGYVDAKNQIIKKESALGQLLLFFMPELATIDGDTYNTKIDLPKKQDNFNWFFAGVIDILSKTLLETRYDNFIKTVLLIDGSFNVRQISEQYFPKTNNIKRREYTITYNLELVNEVLKNPKNEKLKQITYNLTFEKTKESDQKYKISRFAKTN